MIFRCDECEKNINSSHVGRIKLDWGTVCEDCCALLDMTDLERRDNELCQRADNRNDEIRQEKLDND